MSERYDVVTSRKDKDGKWRSTRIGAAFPKDGRISIVLDALPMPNGEGQAWLTLFPAKDKTEDHQNERPVARRSSAEMGRDLNDEIPF